MSADEEAERTQMEEVLRDLGVPEEAIARAVERDDPVGAVFEASLLPGKAERTVSAAEIEAQGGLSVAEVAGMLRAMGFPAPSPDEPALTPAEARVFVELGQLREVWPYELSQQLARMYGRLLSRIARTAVQMVRLYSEPRLRAASDSHAEALASLRDALDRLVSLPDPVLAGVHRRWIEYEVSQAAAGAAESEAGGAPLPGAVEVSLLFCDLKDFTAYANAEGDIAAVDAIEAFAHTVYSQRGEDGRVVKALGDGHMICYTEASEAVAAGSRIIAAMGDGETPGVHASVHRGTAIAREGDYFGGAVNIAARLLAVAGRDELVATGSVVEACPDSLPWEPLGAHLVRGVREPVEVFRLLSAPSPPEATPRGPVG